VYGTIGKLLYIGVWLFSLASPLVLLSLVWFQLRTWALAFGICMLAPFFLEFHTVPALRRYFAAALAHPSMEFCFEGETFPTARGNVDKADPRARQPVLFCFHPHGIFPQGWGFAFLNDKFRNTRFLMARALFTSPFFRVLAQLTGKPSSADKATMTLHMKKGHDIALIPGGFEEASIHASHCDRLFLKHRQGFIKYALQFGYSVCPVYSFGERESYANAPGFYKFRLWLNSWGLPGILPWGMQTILFDSSFYFYFHVSTVHQASCGVRCYRVMCN
jgi:hypothetical protein